MRCWPGGSIPDVAAALGGPIRVSSRRDAAFKIVELVPEFPICTWGRDELGAGEMWNSNSLVSWLLARAGLWTNEIGPQARPDRYAAFRATRSFVCRNERKVT